MPPLTMVEGYVTVNSRHQRRDPHLFLRRLFNAINAAMQDRRFLLPVLCLTLVLALGAGPSHSADWPEFRGPTGQGQSTETGLPLQWSESENIAWKVAIPGQGWSSPVVEGGEIWLTTAQENGSLQVLAIEAASGRVRQAIEVFRHPRLPSIHNKNSYASPTPILESDRVYVHFGTLGTAALSRDGRILWTNQELRYEHRHGPGGSPALAGALLVISCDGTDRQYVVALDKNTGEIRWRKDRRVGAMAYTTPLVIETEGREQVVSAGGNRAVSYDLKTGQALWWIGYDGFSLITRPVFGHGLVYLTSGYNRAVLFAVRPDGRGDVSASHVAWRLDRGAPNTPSPLLVGDEIYVVSDRGIASCLDARSGKLHWRQRLSGSFSASPVYADGRIYFLNESGETSVVKPGTSFELLARNPLPGRTLASIAVAEGAIFLRTATHLYRIEQR